MANSLEGTHGKKGITRHSVYDLSTTYLPAFKAAVEQDWGRWHNVQLQLRQRCVPMCGNEYYLKKRLHRRDWRFRGYMSSDSGALDDIDKYHHYTHVMWKVLLGMRMNRG